MLIVVTVILMVRSNLHMSLQLNCNDNLVKSQRFKYKQYDLLKFVAMKSHILCEIGRVNVICSFLLPPEWHQLITSN